MRKYVLALLLTAAAFTVGLGAEVSAGELKLADSGKSEYKILTPANATPVQQTAAKELQTYFQRVTGAELPIISEDSVDSFDGAKLFIVGPGPVSSRALGGFDESSFKSDEIAVKAVGTSVVLSGSAPRGSLYAVYEFLENALGVRWFSSQFERVPSRPTVTLDDSLDVRYAPPLEYRESFYRDAFTNPYAPRIRCNGDTAHIPPEFGGKNEFIFGCHSAFTLIPPKEYFREHPDWFAEIDGVRRVGAPFCWGMEDQLEPGQAYGRGTQLCFSNDEMIEEMIKNAREAARSNPGATFIDVSQNDCEGYCECEKCRAIDEEEGSHAGSLLRAVNKVAEALEKEFPNLYVETLAYRYTRKPPKITKPRRNVVVRLCSIECSFAQPLDSDINASFRDDLLGWSKICDKLFIWDYATDFGYYVLPFPNYRVLAPNTQFYVDHNVMGILEQGDYQSPTGDFVELRAWMVAKLLWNPQADVSALFDDFVSGYYAPELVPIYREYFNLLSDAVEKNDFNLNIYLMTTRDWLDVETLLKTTRLQNQALEIAQKLEKEQPEFYAGLVDRVERGRLPLKAVWAQEYRRALVESRLRGLEFLGPDDPVAMCKEYLQLLDDYGFLKRRESEPGDMYPTFRAQTLAEYAEWRTPFAPKPDVCAEAADDAWLDLQEYEFVQEKDGPAIVEDASASNGYAVEIKDGQGGSWNVPEYASLLRPESGADRVYAYVTLDESAEIVATAADPDGAETELARASKSGTLDLGAANLKPGAKILIAAQGGTARVDRLVIVRTGEPVKE